MPASSLLASALLLLAACDGATEPSDLEPGERALVVAPSGMVIAGVGSTATFEVVDSTGADVPDSVTWFSLAPAVATVDSLTGVVTAVSAGQAVIGARLDTLEIGSGLVTVIVPGGAIQGWSVDTLTSADTVTGIWSAGPDDALAVGSAGALRHTPDGWRDACPGGLDLTSADVWGVSSREAFIPQRRDAIIHVHDGWCGTVEISTRYFTLTAVWAAAPDDAWVTGVWTYYTGLRTILFRYDGQSWRDVSSTLGNNLALFDLWGSARDDVWGVGQSGSLGLVRQFTGNTWYTHDVPPGGALQGVWGSSSSDVFAVGENGRILHFDGTDWTEMASPVSANLYAVGGAAPNDVFAAGDDVVLHYDGTDWTVVAGAPSGAYRSVWATSGPVYFGADGRVITANR